MVKKVVAFFIYIVTGLYAAARQVREVRWRLPETNR